MEGMGGVVRNKGKEARYGEVEERKTKERGAKERKREG